MSVLPRSSVDAPRCFALVPSAGVGSRSGLTQPKQYAPLAGARVIDHTLAAFLRVPEVTAVLVVVAPDDTAMAASDPRVVVRPVGGASRAESVFNGLAALQALGAQPTDWVMVHDAARCMIQPEWIARLMAACQAEDVGGLLAVPVPDTLKQAAPAGRQGTATVATTLDRADKWLAQTPQMFRWGELHAALALAAAQGFAGITDEASAVERMANGSPAGFGEAPVGVPLAPAPRSSPRAPLLVIGSTHNFKVTYPEDFALAGALLALRGHAP